MARQRTHLRTNNDNERFIVPSAQNGKSVKMSLKEKWGKKVEEIEKNLKDIKLGRGKDIGRKALGIQTHKLRYIIKESES